MEFHLVETFAARAVEEHVAAVDHVAATEGHATGEHGDHAVVADTDFTPSPPLHERSPCPACAPRTCIATCPADALQAGQFDLDACSRYRLQPDSACAHGCLARQACPAGAEHRYDPEQIRHSYSRSLAVIRRYYAT